MVQVTNSRAQPQFYHSMAEIPDELVNRTQLPVRSLGDIIAIES